MKFNLRFVLAGLITASALLSTACNTIEGIGRDLESTGHSIEEAAKKR